MHMFGWHDGFTIFNQIIRMVMYVTALVGIRDDSISALECMSRLWIQGESFLARYMQSDVWNDGIKKLKHDLVK